MPRDGMEKNFKLYCVIQLKSSLVWWLARQTAIQEVPGSIPGYTLEIFLEVAYRV